MNIQDLGSIGEFVAALATILTLGYLALQIRASNRQGANSAMHRFDEEFIRINTLALTERDQVDLIIKLRSKDRFTEEEKTRAHHYATLLLNQYRAIDKAFSLGQIDRDYYVSKRNDARNVGEGLPRLIPYFRYILEQSYRDENDIPEILLPLWQAAVRPNDADESHGRTDDL